jgi:hypothetical protein
VERYTVQQFAQYAKGKENKMDDKIIGRIRKLMAVANGNAEGGQHERDTALKMAHNLLAKHNLSMADVKEEDKEGRSTKEKYMTSHAWAKIVAGSIAELFFCGFFTTKVGPRGTTRMKMTFIGLESNVATAKEMVDYVVSSISSEAARKARQYDEGGSYVRTFCNGAAYQIAKRCRELRKAAEEESAATPQPGTALVLASLYKREVAANDQYVVAVLGIELEHKPLRPQIKDNGAYIEGRMYGDKINLSKQIK